MPLLHSTPEINVKCVLQRVFDGLLFVSLYFHIQIMVEQKYLQVTFSCQSFYKLILYLLWLVLHVFT